MVCSSPVTFIDQTHVQHTHTYRKTGSFFKTSLPVIVRVPYMYYGSRKPTHCSGVRRPAKSHGFAVSLTIFDTFSQSHDKGLKSHDFCTKMPVKSGSSKRM